MREIYIKRNTRLQQQQQRSYAANIYILQSYHIVLSVYIMYMRNGSIPTAPHSGWKRSASVAEAVVASLYPCAFLKSIKMKLTMVICVYYYCWLQCLCLLLLHQGAFPWCIFLIQMQKSLYIQKIYICFWRARA